MTMFSLGGGGSITLTSPTINGTVATTGLTMPTFTAGGDISLGANKLKTTTLYLDELDSNTIAVRAITGDTYKYFKAARFLFTDSIRMATGNAIFASGSGDDDYMSFNAKDNDVGDREVARMSGADDPWFGLGNNANALKATRAGLVGFFGATPVAQQVHVADPTGGATVDAEARTAINAINAICATFGLTAAS